MTRLSYSVPVALAENYFRIDITPNLAAFPIAYKNFLNYRLNKVHYQLIPRFNISSAPGVLPVLYSLPLSSNQVPAPTPAAFIAFANCRVS